MEPTGFDPPSIASVLRLILAAVLGGLVGLDRESRGKPAGFRTNILICVGAALLMELSLEVARRWVETYGTVADPARIAAQIVSGIGFLGAGTIIQSRFGVQGLTTAAGLWVVAAIGMAAGAGEYLLALATTGVVMITLALLGRLETWLEPRTLDVRWLRVRFASDSAGAHRPIEALLAERGVRIRGMELERKEDALHASFRAEARTKDWDGLLEAILRHETVTRATLE
jgi:putative Mg2+ transporter-C (MgtC) family protein